MSNPSLRRIDRLINEIQASTLGEVTSALFCRRGHHLSPDNLCSRLRCRQCHRDNEKRAEQAKANGQPLRVSMEPLQRLIYVQERLFEEGRPGLAGRIANRLGANQKSILRLLERASTGKGTISAANADRLAIAMGTHPVLLWAEEWAA